jgi:16S rRNA (guanine527-N7)-methyltransferase
LLDFTSQGSEEKFNGMTKRLYWDGSNDQIEAALFPFGVHPSDEQIAKIRVYVHLLLKWNKLISLTTITDPGEIVERHFGESIFLTTLLPVENCRLADVGSGAGFPGLAIKIFCPDTHVLLVESNKKKAAFLSEVIRTLGLSDVEVLPIRYEDMRPEGASLDLITARAVGGFPEFLAWSKRALAHRGHVALWVGGEDTTKISTIQGWIWRPAVHIPESKQRFILIGRCFVPT